MGFACAGGECEEAARVSTEEARIEVYDAPRSSDNTCRSPRDKAFGANARGRALCK